MWGVVSLTVRERVIASRLIQKIDGKVSYAKQIGLSYELEMGHAYSSPEEAFRKKQETK